MGVPAALPSRNVEKIGEIRETERDERTDKVNSVERKSFSKEERKATERPKPGGKKFGGNTDEEKLRRRNFRPDEKL